MTIIGPLADVNIPETTETLLHQQRLLMAGRRPAQLFPRGTPELPLPPGMLRFVAEQGIFHYDPRQCSRRDVETAAQLRYENLILNLGPYNKEYIFRRCLPGAPEYCIVERTPDGIELRAAITCMDTLVEQMTYFEGTKEPDTTLEIEPASFVLYLRTKQWKRPIRAMESNPPPASNAGSP